MMMNILTVALGVGLGTSMVSIIALCVLLNKRVLKWYTKHVMKVSMEITSEMFDTINERFKDEEGES